MQTRGRDHQSIIVGIDTLTGYMPGPLRIVVKSNGHIVAGNGMRDGLNFTQNQVGETAAADIGIEVRTVDGNALAIADPGDLQIIDADRDGSALIPPVSGCAPGYNDRTLTGTGAGAITAVIRDR